MNRFPSRVSRISLALVLSLTCLGVANAERNERENERSNHDERVIHKSYTFEDGEEIPYAVFVPSSYDKAKPHPLIVSLHGLTRQYDWLMRYHGFLDQAERGGFIVVTPLGYTRDGWYGSRPKNEYAKQSEQDVMNVLKLVRKDYIVDENRIYLWGHSMGGAGTYHLAAKYPEIWAGLGVAAPAPGRSLDMIEQFKHIPIIVLQGDEDELVPTAVTRNWVERMQQLGMQYVYVEIEGGDHSLFIAENAEAMSKIVDFFKIVRKKY